MSTQAEGDDGAEHEERAEPLQDAVVDVHHDQQPEEAEHQPRTPAA